MNLTAVCSSRSELDWPVTEIPFVLNTRNFMQFPRDASRGRIEYLADRRNETHRLALARYPDTTHFLSIDSYYCDQPKAIRDFVAEYKRYGTRGIWGASNWCMNRAIWPARKLFWDTWTTPEMLHAKYDKTGVFEVKGVGGIVIYPVEVWKERPYAVPANFPEAGCEMNHLCQHDPVCFLTFNEKFMHPTPRGQLEKPFIDRVRTTLGIGTKVRGILAPH